MRLPDRQVGYNALISRYGLLCVEDRISSFIAKRLSVIDRKERADGSLVVRYPGKYDFDDTLAGHLEFCLKYEGVNLSALAALFEQRGADDIQAWLDSKPGSRYARVCGHLYEWLTGKTLRYKLPPGIDAVPVLENRGCDGLEGGNVGHPGHYSGLRFTHGRCREVATGHRRSGITDTSW